MANNITVKDSLAATVTVKTTDTGGVHTPHHNIDTIAVPGTFYHGQKTIASAGTEEAIASSQALLSGVTVKALHSNTGWVYVGKNPVTSSTGYVLDAGEEVFIETDNLTDVFIDVSVNGEGVSYLGS